MSGKALKDEKQDLQKQIGCITGFFQLFDRHRFLAGQRTSSYIPHTTTSGGSNNEIKEFNSTVQNTKAKTHKIARDKQQFSTESSITSVSSSSCSSSMSSLELNRTIQTESPSTSQISRIPQNPHSEVAMKQHDTPVAMKQHDTPGQQLSLDFYDIVKDSMHREAQRLSVKTVAEEGKKGQTYASKRIDSPRPLRSPKSVKEGVMVANAPIHIPSKSKRTQWDSPRLSYDGRHTQDPLESATKHKELPRLSLDSRKGSIRGVNEGNKAHNLLNGPQKGYGRNSSTMLNQLQEPETSRRSSGIVAKLMGLEALPDLTQTCGTLKGTSSCSTNKKELLARTSAGDGYKQCQSSASPRTCQGFTLPQSRRADSIANATPYSRFVLESTPWRQPDVSQSSQLQASKGSESDIKASKSSLSVYGEIEKRLAELEFKKSGKDLRALKQILEAMQRYKDPSSDNRNNTGLSENSKVQSPRIQQNDLASVAVEMSNSTRGSTLPIVIMKSAKVTRKANNPPPTEFSIHDKSGLSKSSPRNPTNGRLVDKQKAKGNCSTTKNIKDTFGQPVPSADKNSNLRTSKLMQSSKVPQDNNGKNTTNSGNITVTGSPRLQKKFGLERRAPPTSPSLDSSINRRQHNRQPVELSSSSATTPITNFSIMQDRNERFSEISCHWRNSKHHVNVISSDFDSRSLATYSEIEVIRFDQSGDVNSTPIQHSGLNQNNAFEELRKESCKAEKIVTAEQPSPVSVLDAAFYRDDPPSPVKKKLNISKNLGEALSTDDDSEENSVDLPPLSCTTNANLSNGFDDRDLNTQNLAQILQEIDWIGEKLINFNNSKNPDHKYISEILLASGLLSGHSSSQILHSPGYLINPKLFSALEQVKTSKRHFNIEDSPMKIGRNIILEQMQRKLVFDAVNDILVQKLILESSSTLAGRKLEGQQLLEELCTEVDQLQPQNRNVSLVHEEENLTSLFGRDLKHDHTIWTNCSSEIPNIVLDIERLIFKDLITEVVRVEVANQFGRHCRQLLFPN